MKDHISICIPTYRRNEMLERLLRNLKNQETNGFFDYSIIVVDNDINGFAKDTVTRLMSQLNLDIIYDIEEKRTIPAVRNRALRLAKGNFIGIIDDDEFPVSDWLKKLYIAINTFEVEGALGPVYPFFEKKPPKWLIKSKFLERPVYRTGTILNWSQTRTGNVLLKKDVFDKYKICFDENFKTGGSDREFFKNAMNAGNRFVAVKEAAVYEIVPPERWDKRYYLKRALVNGYNSNKNSINEITGISRAIIFLKSGFAVLIYAAITPICACIGSYLLMNILEKACHHFSRLMGMAGVEIIKERNF